MRTGVLFARSLVLKKDWLFFSFLKMNPGIKNTDSETSNFDYCLIKKAQKYSFCFIFRFAFWVKGVLPVLDFHNINLTNLKKNGKVCAKHFKSTDFINLKKDSLVHNACPSVGKFFKTITVINFCHQHTFYS